MRCRVQGGIPTIYIISALAPGLVIHCCLSVVGRSPRDPEKLGAVAWGPTPEITSEEQVYPPPHTQADPQGYLEDT